MKKLSSIFWSVVMIVAVFVMFRDAYQIIMAQDITDPSAYASSQKRWGGIADVGYRRKVATESVWTKEVGYDSPGCVNTFTVVATAPNTWTAAFAAADAAPIFTSGGTFKGSIQVQMAAYSEAGIAQVVLMVDGIQNGLPVAPPAGQLNSFVPTFTLDTTTLTNDFHALCGQVTDIHGVVGKLWNGYLFKVDQTAGTTQTGGIVWNPGQQMAGLPALNMSLVTQK